MRKIWRILKISIQFILVALILFFNIQIYSGPTLQHDKSLNADITQQLNFLQEELHEKNLAKRMQNLFPEGYVFTNALYGISWCAAMQMRNNKDTAFNTIGLKEANYAYKNISSEYAKNNFPFDLSPKHGIFYQGWKNYLLGNILKSHSDSILQVEFINQCDTIAKAFDQSETPFLMSYSNMAWPADATVAIASLAIHDQLFKPKYEDLLKTWITKVKQRLDSETGLIPHQTDSENGQPIEGARGSSSSLILSLLPQIDPLFAKDQFALYQKHFVQSICGLPLIREYPKGFNGKGDIDSGPILLGTGFAATIVGIGAIRNNGELRTAQLLSNTIDCFGFPLTSKDSKKYIFGTLPISDAFIAWSRSIKKEGSENHLFTLIPFRFHLWSILIIVLIYMVFNLKKVLRKFKVRKV